MASLSTVSMARRLLLLLRNHPAPCRRRSQALWTAPRIRPVHWGRGERCDVDGLQAVTILLGAKVVQRHEDTKTSTAVE